MNELQAETEYRNIWAGFLSGQHEYINGLMVPLGVARERMDELQDYFSEETWDRLRNDLPGFKDWWEKSLAQTIERMAETIRSAPWGLLPDDQESQNE